LRAAIRRPYLSKRDAHKYCFVRATAPQSLLRADAQ